jgi:tetratricopeptide (TPR) repeat protein
MGAVQYLFALALRPLIDGIGKSIEDPSARIDAIGNQLNAFLGEHRPQLTRALNHANERSWQALELALGGEALWDIAATAMRRAADEPLRQHLRVFYDAVPVAAVARREPDLRRQCSEELRLARTEGHLTPGELDLSELLQKATDCLRPTDPQDPRAEDEHVLQRMAEAFRQLNYAGLARLLAEREPRQLHLLAAAAWHFFRRALENEGDTVLLQQLKPVSDDTGATAAMSALGETLPILGSRVDEFFLELQQSTRDGKSASTDGAGLENEVFRLVEDKRLRNRAMRPSDCLAFADDEEVGARARDLVARYRDLPEGKHASPAFREAIGMLQVALGMYEGALQAFQHVSGQASDDAIRARAHWNAYQVALVQSLWSEALEELRQAIQIAPALYAPFPLDYEIERVLGVGGFGVSFLCRDGAGGKQVVAKALRTDWLGRPVEDLFRELRGLRELEHPALVKVLDYGLAQGDPERPYIVSDYFEGHTLPYHIFQAGAVPPATALAVIRALAQGLQIVHARGIWHRHLTPGNIFVQPEGDTWNVKLADFGPGLRANVFHATVGNPVLRSHTVIGRSVTGMVDYAAPEQLGLLDGVEPGPESNLYNLGRIGYFLLLGNPVPDEDEKEGLPEAWRKLLGRCVARMPEKRPAGVAGLLEQLAELSEAAPTVAVADAATTVEHREAPEGEAAPPAEAPTPGVPHDARGFHDRGVAYAAKNAYDKAIADFNRALELDPNFASALCNRGEMLRLKGDYEGAFADFTQALKVDPKHAPALVNRGRVYRVKGRIDRALQDFTQANRLDPKSADALINRGNAFTDKGEFDRAITDYTEALNIDPNLALAYMNRGLAYAKKGDFDAVVEDCEAAIKQNPKMIGAYFIRGAAHSSKGEFDKAIADFTRVLQLDPNYALAYNDRGLALANKKEYDKAIADYNRALRRDPKLALAYMNRAIAYRLKGDDDRAIAEFTKMLRLSPKNVLAYTNRGMAYMAKRDYDRAIADFTEALWIDPQYTEAYNRRVEAVRAKGDLSKVEEERRTKEHVANEERQRRQERATAHFTRAQMHFDNGNFDKAVTDFTEALKYDPKDAFTYYNRGLACAANEDYDKALADYTEAVRLNPKLAVAYYHRGVGYRLRGNFARAIADFSEAIKLDAKYALAYRNRGLAYAALGEQGKAKADYDEAVKLDATLAKK